MESNGVAYKIVMGLLILTQLKGLFSAEDKLGKNSKPATVYKFCCTQCKSCYNCETTKVINVRAKDHLFYRQIVSGIQRSEFLPRMQSGIRYLMFFGH